MNRHAPDCTQDDLIRFNPRHDSFVGIDSDGCVFDTMEIKQKRCFHPLIIRHWRLEKIEPYVRETAEFVNLYSMHRGQNRFPCLLLTFDLLRERPEVAAAGVALPSTRALKAFCESGLTLGNPALAARAKETNDPELTDLLAWSLAINKDVEAKVKNVPIFPWVTESLQKIRQHSDAICVSQTPTEALVREWDEHHLTNFVEVIAGQELGTKSDHLRLATDTRYRPERVLMIGDAPGDRKAARSVQASFYPINPGDEAASWERFFKEAYERFLAGTYRGDYENALIAEFERRLPDTPPWKLKGYA